MTARLPTRRVAKPWGRKVLPPPFGTPKGEREGEPIGEIWFEPPPSLASLLVKYIFTSEALSVQVHPSDAQLPGHGKEECWLVTGAEPGARLGVGFNVPLDGDAMRAAALDGSIEHLLHWYPVAPGDFFYIPAGTVHAIGAGVSLIEVQQNSDVTYRLYDYGRPRELHLDAGVAVARGEELPARYRRHVPDGAEAKLVDGPLFRLDLLQGPASPAIAARYGQGPLLVIPLSQGTAIKGEAIAPGDCGLAEDLADLSLANGASCLIAQPCE
ncbi:MAG: class I mannose-6-phosphate isomerase [Novosphingobium sp.]